MQRILALTFALTFTACGLRHAAPAGPEPSEAERLLGSQWRLTELDGQPLPAGVDLDLGFVAPGRIAGNTGCNRFVGPVEIGPGGIRVGPLATSRRACRRDLAQREAAYLEALHATTRLRSNPRSLTLRRDGTQPPLRFRRIPPPPTVD